MLLVSPSIIIIGIIISSSSSSNSNIHMYIIYIYIYIYIWRTNLPLVRLEGLDDAADAELIVALGAVEGADDLGPPRTVLCVYIYIYIYV